MAGKAIDCACAALVRPKQMTVILIVVSSVVEGRLVVPLD